jgi:hypothetical protein
MWKLQAATQEFNYPPQTLEISQTNYFLFKLLKNFLQRKRSSRDEECMMCRKLQKAKYLSKHNWVTQMTYNMLYHANT